jgi:hypothetical protein
MHLSLISVILGGVFFLFSVFTTFYYIKILYFQFLKSRKLTPKERLEYLIKNNYFEKMNKYAIFASLGAAGFSLSIGSSYLLARSFLLIILFYFSKIFMRNVFKNFTR